MIVATIQTHRDNASAERNAPGAHGFGRTVLTLTYTGSGITIRTRHANAQAAQEYARKESRFAKPDDVQ